MALVDNAWYINSVGYTAVTAWAASTAYVVGNFRRQLTTPTVNNERTFVCIVAGTSLGTEPTWVLTRGAKTTDNTVTWMECSGVAAINGDLTNTPSWTITATPPGGVKNTAVSLGQVIKRDNGASYQICTTAGTAGNATEPAFSNTAGVTTTDNTVTWTSLGVVGNFTGWQYPMARWAISVGTGWGAQTGDIFYFASEHAETKSTALTASFAGTLLSPTNHLCVTKTNVPPTSANLTTGASITTTGTSNVTLGSAFGVTSYVYGITINCGTGAGAATLTFGYGGGTWLMEKCTFNKLGTTGIVTAIQPVGDITCIDCGFGFGNTVDSISCSYTFKMYGNNTTFTGSVPSELFTLNGGLLNIDSVDLSNIPGLLNNASIIGSDITFKNCKLHPTATFAASARNVNVNVINCDSTATNYRHERYLYEGTQTVETTIVRSGGATNGTTPIAWKIVTTANSLILFPFTSLPIIIWNDTIATKTITIYGIWDAGAVPTNADIWMEVNYMGSSATPIGSRSSSGVSNIMETGTNLTTDTSTWGGSTTKFKMSVTLNSPSPSMKGPIYVTVKAAKVSSTFYIDPKPVIT